MPVRPRYFEKRNLAYLEHSGDITPADYLSPLGTGSAPPWLRSDTMVLVDLARARSVVAGFSETVAAVTLHAPFSAHVTPGTRLAMHAPLDLAFGAARMFDQVAENALPWDIAVCRTEAAALAHLRQPETSLRAFLIAAV